MTVFVRLPVQRLGGDRRHLGGATDSTVASGIKDVENLCVQIIPVQYLRCDLTGRLDAGRSA